MPTPPNGTGNARDARVQFATPTRPSLPIEIDENDPRHNGLTQGVKDLREAVQEGVRTGREAFHGVVETLGEGVGAVHETMAALGTAPAKAQADLQQAADRWTRAGEAIEDIGKTTSAAKTLVGDTVNAFSGLVSLLDSFGPAVRGDKPDKETALAQNTPAPRSQNTPAP